MSALLGAAAKSEHDDHHLRNRPAGACMNIEQLNFRLEWMTAQVLNRCSKWLEIWLRQKACRLQVDSARMPRSYWKPRQR